MEKYQHQNVYAKKSLGQNFLRSTKALTSIIKAGDISIKDTILEIGPGRGALTQKLLETGAHIIAVEKDTSLVEVLSEVFEKQIHAKQLILKNGDILKETPKSLRLKKYKLIANIPYYITGEIIRFFLETKQKPNTMVLLVQKEVAERIVCRDNKESILSLSIKAYGNATYIETVPSKAFNPSPKVDSAIIKISDITQKFQTTEEEKLFFITIKTAFKAKRKKAISNLKTLYNKDDLENFFTVQNLSLDIRPEKIPFSVWLELIQKYPTVK